MPEVIKLKPHLPALPQRLRVAAYARVSMESERLAHSLSAQISYYNDLIQKNPEWEYAGVYADSFISGTSALNRPELQRLIADCENGKIHIVLTKSISRFARNTVDLLNIVRHLKSLGVSVRFEKENIDSLSSDGELMLTVLASFAEEESKAISSNIKWSIQKKFQRGETWHTAAFGYRWNGSTFIIQPDEANVVRRIYADFLNDVPLRHIAKWMQAEGWGCCNVYSIEYILTNIVYTGNVITQKYYTVDPLTHEMRKNEGQLPRYWIENNHAPIITQETYDAVQQKIQASYDFNPEAHRFTMPSCFSAKIACPICGSNYVRNVVKTNAHDGLQESWLCYGKIKSRKQNCNARNIKGDRLRKAAAVALGIVEFDEQIFSRQIQRIQPQENSLLFTFYNGNSKTVPIQYFNQADKKHQDPHTTFFGYQWSSVGYIIIPHQAEAVKVMYELYANGMTISDIRRCLVDMGMKSSHGSMSNKLIANALDSILYIGDRILKAQFSPSGHNELLKNDHEPIISVELDRKVKERRKIELKKQERRLATNRAKKEALLNENSNSSAANH